VFVYDVRPEFADKACTLALYIPPPFTMPEMAPVHIRSPGGVSVLRLANQVDSVGGFEADWFQMAYPVLRLFLLVR
jgi:hypothetical protein